MNTKIRFNDGWEFAKSTLEAADCAGLVFEPVDIPHDWLIYNTADLYEDSIGWYRKSFLSAADGRRLLLCFDGVYMDSTVYVNGRQVGEWKYGYSSFEFEITSALVAGENEILVKVVHQSPNSRWYSGAGIYRNVWLKISGSEYIVTDSIYVTTKQIEDDWRVEIDTEVHHTVPVTLTHTVSFEGKVIAAVSAELTPTGTEATLSRQTLHILAPQLWSVDAPHLYELSTRLLPAGAAEDDVIETVSQAVGFRTIIMDQEYGLFVNGQPLKLNGVCEHHDLGALGAAFNKTAMRRRLVILKEMGVNAIRTSHNMPAPELMELADEMGFLVASEAFDMWERSKTTYDYARFFPEWVGTDVRSWVLRDRNHPCLLLWSIGNEIYDTHADERGQEVTRMLMELVHRYDPKGNAAVTIGSNYMPWENAQKCADIVKIAGYNYAEKYYRKHHEEHPDWVIYGSETASVVQSRGIYHFPFEKPILADDDEQCSSLGNSTTSWGAKSPEACIIAERDTPFSMGQFLWTGFDYIGEPTPYHTKNSYFGQIDTATFPKDSYYVYQAEWTDYRVKPMVHIFPYWDFNSNQLIDVRVCSNAPRIELLLNGDSLGTFDIDHAHGTQLVGWWKVPYEPGELKAVAYDENGGVIAVDVKYSFGDPRRVVLKADKQQLVGDGQDLVFVEIGMEDEQGHPVENANNRVQVRVTGAGRLLGLDNGDSTDYDPYKGCSRRLFSGKLMAVIGSGVEPGAVRVEVTSQGLAAAVIELESVAVAAAEAGSVLAGVSAFTTNRELACLTGALDELPLRKLEIISGAGQLFNLALREIQVQVRLHPAETSYQEVEWSVVDDAGIESNIAKVEASGQEAKLTALGDGQFRLRCMSKNGTDKVKLVSQLEFKAEGLGIAYLDPYGFVTGGLYDYSKGDVGNGNDRGVATSRDGETQVGFRNLDFGPYGSDTITVPIFALSSEEYPLQIWEGVPGEEGSMLLADVIYQKPSIWNTYQEETYRLNKRLRGITTLCFVLRQKVHIKGFSFERMNRGFAKNAAADADKIYGDTFTVTGDIVEGIGNNVSLVFDELGFGSAGTGKLVVCGRSPIDKNTIHVRFSGEDGDSNQLVEFTWSEGYKEQVYELEQVKGVQKVTFVFLPGSNFDFGWFRFE